MEPPALLFVGGGTAGHVAPILAVIQAVEAEATARRQQFTYHYAGLATDIASPLLETVPVPLHRHTIQAGKLHRHFNADHIVQAGRTLAGLWQAERLVARIRPVAVFAKGGYVGVPIALAAARRGIPVITHETDARMGLANRINGLLVKATCCTSFPVAVYPGNQGRLVYTGQPVREEFYRPAGGEALVISDRPLKAELPVVTIVGGSQGAHGLNTRVAAVWGQLAELAQVVHLTGPRDFGDLAALAAASPVAERLFLAGFTRDIAELYKRSTVVVSRSGGSIFELAAVGVAAVLVPLPTSAQDHQRANARILAAAGAAVTLDQDGLSSETLAVTVSALCSDGERRQHLQGAIRSFAVPEAAQRVARVILNAVRK